MSAENIEQALQAVLTAFAARRQPVNVPLQTCCVSKAHMKKVWNTPYDQLTGADLHALVWHTDVCWGGWADLAFYVPRLATLYAKGGLIDEDILLTKWVHALPSEAESLISAPEKLLPAEQSSLAQLMRTVLEFRLSQPKFRGMDFMDALIVLGAFGMPLSPLLQHWKDSQDLAMQRNLLIFLMDYGKSMSEANKTYDPQAPVPEAILNYNSWRSLGFSAENNAALDALLNPKTLAAYLFEHIEEAEQIGSEWETGLAEAYDWAASHQPQSNANTQGEKDEPGTGR